MSRSLLDSFDARTLLSGSADPVYYFRLSALEEAGIGQISRLPFSIKILLEALLRQVDGFAVTVEDVRRLANWDAANPAQVELPFKPARVVMQDFTGVPAIVDLAAMRAAVARLGGDPKKINPLVPVDLVIDHSIQVDFFATGDALNRNTEMEFLRNRERYEFLKWGQKAFSNFRVVPPMTGIVHQVNLEYLADVVMTKNEDGGTLAFPDTVVGTDSHTTMINGLGVAGWGVGGIEAEAVMLGQPMDMLLPDVIGFQLHGKLKEGVTATDLVLTVTQMLRKKGVVDKFVEFYGEGLASMSLTDRATIANMAPEYGATMGFFPVDERTIEYFHGTGRRRREIEAFEAYFKAQGLFGVPGAPGASQGASDIAYSRVVRLDLGTVALPIDVQASIALDNGTGANQADKVFTDTRTVTTGATDSLDLAGSLTDAFGATITLARVKAILVKAASGNGGGVAPRSANPRYESPRSSSPPTGAVLRRTDCGLPRRKIYWAQ